MIPEAANKIRQRNGDGPLPAGLRYADPSSRFLKYVPLPPWLASTGAHTASWCPMWLEMASLSNDASNSRRTPIALSPAAISKNKQHTIIGGKKERDNQDQNVPKERDNQDQNVPRTASTAYPC